MSSSKMNRGVSPSARRSGKACHRGFRLNKNAVSEALGTILLLAVAVVLVSAMFVWTQTIPKLDEGKSVNFSANYENNNLTIKHMGGDYLEAKDIEIKVIFETTSIIYYLTDDPVVGGDKLWSPGEVWHQTIPNANNSKIDVFVYEVSNQILIFSDELFPESQLKPLPDLAISPDNITFNYPGATIRRYVWTNISLSISNHGSVDVKNAIVRVFAGSTVIEKDGTDRQIVDVPANSNIPLWVNWTPQRWGLQNIFVKIYSGVNEMDYSNNYAFKEVLVDIQTTLVHGPDLQMTTWDILMFPENPTRGDDVKITVIVHNLGDEPVFSSEGATLILRDTEVQWNTTTDRANYRDGVFLNQTFYNISVPANGIIQQDFLWEARPGGNITIYAYIDVNNSVIETKSNNGALEFNNLATRTYKVLPKILLVDDDNVTSGDYDSGTKLRQAMIAAGATFDMYFTTGSEDPYYDFGSKQVKDYDIIVWTTGYEKTNTLTTANTATLKRAMVNGTYLWLVGQDILAELSTKFDDADGDPEAGEFIYDYLGIDSFTYPSGGVPSILEGITGDAISHDLRLNMSDVFPGKDRGANISAFKSDSLTDRINGIFYNTSELGSDGNASMRYYNISRDFKTVYFGYDFSAINNPVSRAQVAFRVLRWLNWTLTFGTDFAVAEETFSKSSPKYLDRVWINATLLNNGPTDENVTVAFYVTGPDGVERLIQRYPDFQKNPFSTVIPGQGGRTHVSKQWLAVDVGLHNFRVVVDPFDAFQEISEENNDITYSDLNTELDVSFSILIVDDDNSTNNGGSDIDMVTSIAKALDILEYDFDIQVVPGGLAEASGPNVDTLKHYKAVLWCTGEADIHTLNKTDQLEIGSYLSGAYEESSYIPDLSVNFILIGTNIIEDLNGSGTNVNLPPDSFLEKYMHVDMYSTGIAMDNVINGVFANPLSHGLDYKIDLDSTDFDDKTTDTLVPTSDARGLFWKDSTKTAYDAISYNRSNYKVIFVPWAFNSIAPSELSTETNQSEFMFLLMNWFGYPEKRIELRTYSVDIELSDDNPVIGNSYILRTNVFNYGGTDTSAIVRYYDKDTIIDTQTVFVPALGNSTSEIIWVPLFAGNRTIHVKVDAANDIPEIFEYINNNGTRPNEEVFFFYDDMERGTGNWNHESTIYRIRGESPLDYMDEPVYTRINGTWDEVSGFKNNYVDYHSANASFYATEPEGTTSKPILDLVIVFDTSNSMGEGTYPDRPIDKAKAAARSMIDYLDDESRVALFQTASNPGQRNVTLDEEGWIRLNQEGRDTLMNDPPHYLSDSGSSSAELNPQSFTTIWITIGEAVTAAKTMGREGKTAVIVLSDGQDYQGDDTNIGDPPSYPSDYNGLEYGSAVESKNEPTEPGWCPWGNWSTLAKYPIHWGKYFGTTSSPGYWFKVDFASPTKGDWAYGLLNAPLPVYTIGLSLETATNRSGDINEPAFINISTVSFNDRHGDVYEGSEGLESGTPEYNLYRIAKTSGAKYFYSPSADQLADIFGRIAKEITATLARSSSRATDIGIETKYALTGEFNLVGMDSAKLTFYHKYNLYLGYNGGIVRVGTVNESGGWEYKYVQPTQLYNSNLFLKRTEFDDFGTPMLWCWNGISGAGLFDWEYAEFDLAQFIGQPRVRINFTLVLYGGGAGGGWWLDDVEVRVSRANTNPITSVSRDQWEWTDRASHSGDFSWWNHNATTNNLTGGIDNSLMTRKIDLTKARNATLTAYLRFNINASTGRPPDGFRVEVSSDNGLIWKPINLGVRAAWGVSGTESDAADGIPNDGRSPTGLDPDGDNWVEAGTLSRLSTDLSGWRGSVIKVRFRIVTTTGPNPFWDANHYEDANAGFGGVFVDDVIIYGESIEAEAENVRSTNTDYNPEPVWFGEGSDDEPADETEVPGYSERVFTDESSSSDFDEIIDTSYYTGSAVPEPGQDIETVPEEIIEPPNPETTADSSDKFNDVASASFSSTLGTVILLLVILIGIIYSHSRWR